MQEVNYEELKKGDVITVLEWVGSCDRSYVGDIMDVLCVDLPFVVVRRSPHPASRSKLTLDSRRVVMGKPSEEHIKTVRPSVA